MCLSHFLLPPSLFPPPQTEISGPGGGFILGGRARLSCKFVAKNLAIFPIFWASREVSRRPFSCFVLILLLFSVRWIFQPIRSWSKAWLPHLLFAGHFWTLGSMVLTMKFTLLLRFITLSCRFVGYGMEWFVV